jgi:hypothetical protein
MFVWFMVVFIKKVGPYVFIRNATVAEERNERQNTRVSRS